MTYLTLSKSEFWISNQRQQLQFMLVAWLSFLSAGIFYCYSFAAIQEGGFKGLFYAAMLCVSKDWLLWMALSPVLWHQSAQLFRQSPLRSASLLHSSILKILFAIVTFALAARLSLEWLLDGQVNLVTLLLYVPRYFAAGVILFFACTLLYQYFNPVAEKAHKAKSEQRFDSQIIVNKGIGKAKIAVKDVIKFNAAGNYIEVDTEHETYLMRSSMKALSGRLNPAQFTRVHRSHIVNTDHIDFSVKSMSYVQLKNGNKVKLGEQFADNLLS